MYYSPVFDIYDKYKKHIHSFLFYIGVYLLLVVLEPIFSSVFWLSPRVLILGFVLLIYTAAFFIVHRYKLQSQFSGLFSYDLAYTTFLALATFFFYMVFVRPRFQ